MASLNGACVAISVLAAVYWLVALACVGRYARRRLPPLSRDVPVSVLKPLCGDDGQLYDNLASFFRQRHRRFQLLLGVRAGDDPAVAVATRLCQEFPQVEAALVIDDRVIGTNLKVSNLANLVPYAKHDTLIISDADMRVGADYISVIAATLHKSEAGMVTCLYRGVPGPGWSSRLEAMFINEWFFPAALMGMAIERLRHGFGATIALRRTTLEAIGGVGAVADQLADDHMLGRLVDRLGLRVVLSPYVVDNVLAERNLTALVLHQLRWARTFRTLRPLPYFCSLFTFGIPVSLLWLIVSIGGTLAWASLLAHTALRLVSRVMLARAVGGHMRAGDVWLVPVADTLSFAVGVASFLGRTVRWNDTELYVYPDGRVEPRIRRLGGARTSTASAVERSA
jgi:ceramide glucosyltransferase